MEFEQTCTTSDIAEDKKGAEDLSLCCVCGKSSKKEDIVICVGCDISVHYGEYSAYLCGRALWDED